MNIKINMLQILLLTILSGSTAVTQNSFGIEIRSSHNITYNNGSIDSGPYSYGVTKEDNPITTSYSIGLLYEVADRSTLKMHIGRHQNGRIVDLYHTLDDFQLPTFYQKIDVPYNYIQFTPSYSYNIIDKKIIIPVEIGFSINKRIKEEDIFYIQINEYNYDLRLSSGIKYEMKKLNIGGNLVFSKALNNYLLEKNIYSGEYLPYQVGVEVAIGYFF